MYFHLSRQPVFNKIQAVYAYDLPLRTSADDADDRRAPLEEINRASIEVIAHSSLLTDFKELAGGKRVFINVAADALAGDYVYALPKKTVIVSLDPTIAANEINIAACHKLRNAGYQLALDGLCAQTERIKLLELVHFIKIDFAQKPSLLADELTLYQQQATRLIGLQLVGAKLATRELYRQAMEANCALYQGNYFSTPETITNRDLQAFKLPFMQLLKETQQTDINYANVEKIVKQDTALTFKLLRYVNSAAISRREDVKSIQNALGILGDAEIRKWAALVGVGGLAKGKPRELLAKALTRARFCEDIAVHVKLSRAAGELFLLGICSLLDAILDRPLEQILPELPLGHDVKDALLGRDNSYRRVYECMLAYEDAEWNDVADRAGALALDQTILPKIYVSTVGWVNQQLASEALCA